MSWGGQDGHNDDRAPRRTRRSWLAFPRFGKLGRAAWTVGWTQLGSELGALIPTSWGRLVGVGVGFLVGVVADYATRAPDQASEDSDLQSADAEQRERLAAETSTRAAAEAKHAALERRLTEAERAKAEEDRFQARRTVLAATGDTSRLDLYNNVVGIVSALRSIGQRIEGLRPMCEAISDALTGVGPDASAVEEICRSLEESAVATEKVTDAAKAAEDAADWLRLYASAVAS